MNAVHPDGVGTDARPWWLRAHAALMPDYNRQATVYWWVMALLGAATSVNDWTKVLAAMPVPDQ